LVVCWQFAFAILTTADKSWRDSALLLNSAAITRSLRGIE
jgi:hypothetical protein